MGRCVPDASQVIVFSPRSAVLTVFLPNLARASKEARAFLLVPHPLRLIPVGRDVRATLTSRADQALRNIHKLPIGQIPERNLRYASAVRAIHMQPVIAFVLDLGELHLDRGAIAGKRGQGKGTGPVEPYLAGLYKG